MHIFSRLRAGLYACLVAGISMPVVTQDVQGKYPEAPPAALSKLVRNALETHPRVVAARAAVDAARARQQAANRPLFNPELELDAERAETDSASVGLSQTIDWAGRGDAQAKVAGFEREAAEAELARVRQALASDLLLALSEDHTAGELDRLALRSIEVMDRFADLAERRHQAGDLGQVELDLARLAAAQARLQKAQTALAHTDAQQALAEVLDKVGPTLPSLPTELPELALDQMSLEDLLDRLPELRAQRNRIAAFRATARLRTQERRPNPTVGLRGGREEDDTLLGISMSLPLFVRNNFQAEVEAANADHIQAQQEGQDTYRRAKAHLLSAAKRYSLTQEAWQHWVESGRVSLEQRIDLLQRIWQAGEMGTAEYIVQLKQTIDTQADALELRAQLWRTWFDWLTASGHIEAWLEL